MLLINDEGYGGSLLMPLEAHWRGRSIRNDLTHPSPFFLVVLLNVSYLTLFTAHRTQSLPSFASRWTSIYPWTQHVSPYLTLDLQAAQVIALVLIMGISLWLQLRAMIHQWRPKPSPRRISVRELEPEVEERPLSRRRSSNRQPEPVDSQPRRRRTKVSESPIRRK